MCVICHKPKGSNITKKRAKRLWKINSDGGGFAFINPDNKLETYKSLKFEEWWKLFSPKQQEYKTDFLVHMRIKTHGNKDLANTHPFQVNESTVMAHNGVFNNVPEYKDGRADTKVFIDEVLPELPANWLDSYYLTSMVENFIGFSKLMFLTVDPNLKENVYILNKKKGVTIDKMWFSNSSGVTKRPASVYPIAQYWQHDSIPYAQQKPKSKREPLVWNPVEGDYRPKKKNTKTKPVTVTKVDPLTLALMRNWLKEQRESISTYSKEIIYVEKSDTWECLGCDALVDESTGECECWSKVCKDCENIAAMCECPLGYSMNLVDWKDATQTLQELSCENMGLDWAN